MAGLDRESLDLVLESLCKYAERKLTPDFLLSLDANDEFPKTVLQDLYSDRIGLHLLFLPEQYGGLGGGAYDIYRVAETLAGIDLGISTAVLATFLGTDPIIVGGTEDQKQHWMSRIAAEGLLVAYGATEPQAGSDLSVIKTNAVPVLENDQLKGYRINGQKQWISNGGVAELYTILANTPGGPSWFIVEKNAEGFSSGKPEDKHGLRASNTTSLFLEDVFVEPQRLVGGTEGQGLAQAQAVFGYTRLMVAAFGLGAGWAALKRAIAYSQERVQGGSLLCKKQGFTHKLIVPNAVRLEASRAYIEHTAERIDAGEPGLATEGAIAKYMASEAGNKAAEDAIQALGGYGYTREYMVEKIKRDVRITMIYEGTSEIMEWTIARDRWQKHLKSRGSYYQDWALQLSDLAETNPTTGAVNSALALKALSVLLERCRQDRLTRNQHILFRLGELIAFGETAAVFTNRVANGESKTPNGLDSEILSAMARIHARQAAYKIICEGACLAIGSGANDPQLATSMGIEAVVNNQRGLIADMNLVSEKLIKSFPIA